MKNNHYSFKKSGLVKFFRLPFNFDARFLSPDFNIQYISGHTEGQLVWFEHPAQNPLTANWRSHVISSTDADTFFAITSLPTPDGDIKCIITAGFFADSLAVFWSNDGRWDHGHVSKRCLSTRVDKSFGSRVIGV